MKPQIEFKVLDLGGLGVVAKSTTTTEFSLLDTVLYNTHRSLSERYGGQTPSLAWWIIAGLESVLKKRGVMKAPEDVPPAYAPPPAPPPPRPKRHSVHERARSRSKRPSAPGRT